jgi:hypothetical protein
MLCTRFLSFALGVTAAAAGFATWEFAWFRGGALGQENDALRGRRQQPGTDMTIYSPALHPLYDGQFHLTAGKVHEVGGLNDKPGWDHIDNEAKSIHPVEGTATIDVDEIKNTGKLVAKLKLPEGDFEMVMDRFHEFQPCQDGGVASWIFEHGDSGCGDANWPKTLIYVAGWGYANATLDGKPIYTDYEAHFMITQGMRDRKTLKANYPMLGRKTQAGEVNPAAVQLDFYIRSKEKDPTNTNNPPRKDFSHFICLEVTWR